MVLIGLKAVGTYLPDNIISNIDRHSEAGKSLEFIREKIGFTAVTRKDPSSETSDLCVAAFADLQQKHQIDMNAVDCLVVCTQNPDGHGLPHTSAVVHKKLGLPKSVAAFDISLGCSGYVYGLAVVRSFMEANGLKCGLLFTADPYSKIIRSGDWDTDLLFGDGATVSLLESNPLYRLRRAAFATDGSMGHSIAVRADTGNLEMLGSNVFKFCMTEVPVQILDYLASEKVTSDSIDLFLLHQGSRFIVDNLRSKLELAADNVPFGAGETGNLVSSSIPFLLAQQLELREALPRRILLCGFGVGLSWATMLLDHNPNHEVPA